MHQKHAKDGLAIITVSLDSLEDDKDRKDKVVAFLKGQKATTTNLLMTEDADFVYDKLGFRGTPAMFVFSRQGKWTRFDSDKKAFKDEDVDRLVLELLKEK